MELNNKILYLSFHNSLKKKFGINKLINKDQLRIKLGRQFLVPKNLRNSAIKELVNLNLLKQKEDGFIILEGEFDLENNPNKFYKEIGLL